MGAALFPVPASGDRKFCPVKECPGSEEEWQLHKGLVECYMGPRALQDGRYNATVGHEEP